MEHTSETRDPSRPLRVLIAEDETIIRLDLRGLLEDDGYVVCAEARDGEEAVALARELEPDVAILDIKMPGVDGIEAARRMYAERPLPIVMLTAYADRGLIERAISSGVFTYLTKPFGPNDVVPALRAAVARHDELLAARRSVGDTPPQALRVGLASPSGNVWPLRIDRSPDGSIAVSVTPGQGDDAS
jgi:AmiR/NasT family two-component response regulator